MNDSNRKPLTEMSADEVLNLSMLGLDDTFEFSCKACGKCCKHREDILLTPYDLFRIASYLGRTPLEIVERYCEVYEGRTSHFPVLRVLPVLPDNACPFLNNRKCGIHAKKPVICRVYPLARIFTENDESRFYFNGSNCKHEPKSVTVREWISDIASDESEMAGQIWRDAIMNIHPLIQPESLKISVSEREGLMSMIFNVLWILYDMRQPFIDQLDKNYKTTVRVLNEIIPEMKGE